MVNNIKVSIIIPTKNSALQLETCLITIKKQSYKNVEIIVCDGKSSDDTMEIAKKYKAKIYQNELILAEPGVDLGIYKARGEICIILAADNYLGTVDWLEKMIKPFSDPQIILSYPKQCNPPNNYFWINRYMNVFTDPFNHFVYSYAANTRTFYKEYRVKEKKDGYVVFDFTAYNHPILALAQGTAIRRNYKRPMGMKYDDISPIIDIINKGYKMAYVSDAILYHDSIKSLSQFIRKQRWAVDNALSGKSYGFGARNKYNNLTRKFKKAIFLPYSLSFIFPLFYAFINYIIDNKTEWLFHPFVSWITGIVASEEIFRLKVLHQNYEYKNR